MRRDLILLSGGMDSTTALAESYDAGHAAYTLSVDYGQRHRKELDAAAKVAEYYSVPHRVLDLTGWGALLPGSSLTDSTVDVPHGHYAAPTMSITVVPNRNATLLMAAAGIALSHGCTHVVTGVHAGDHDIYPDCRPDFVDSARKTIELGTEGKVTLDAPFVHTTKTDIADRAEALSAPLELTWSCYEGGDQHCGRCGTCTERREAFMQAGIPDATPYDADLEPIL